MGGAINWLLVLILMAVLPLLAGLVTGTAVGRGLAERGIRVLCTEVVFACFVFTLIASVWWFSGFPAMFVYVVLNGIGMASGSAQIAAFWISVLTILAFNGLAVFRGFRLSLRESRSREEG